MKKNIIGRCSICDGTVVENEWSGTILCISCGAVKRDQLPVIDMYHSKAKILNEMFTHLRTRKETENLISRGL